MEPDIGKIVSLTVKDGVFGDVKFVNLQPDNTDIGAQFASDLSFVNLTVEGISERKTYQLVVKLPFNDPLMRISRNCDAMFHNEVTMYKEILPGLGMDEQIYPKMYCGIATNGVHPQNDLLILENLKYKHFVLSKTKVFLDIDHISLAIKKIGKFHSHSYILKHENEERFLEFTNNLHDVILPKQMELEFGAINVAAMERGINVLLKNNVSVDVLKKCLPFLKCPFKLKKKISHPEEPFAVICHGDFCSNNVLYKYNESGKPVDCVFFDFQLSQYASPAIDLFFFMYMHTTSDLREKYWDQILKLYWDTIRKNVPSHIDIPSLNDFLKHFAKRAIYGYIICSFFLPAMVIDFPIKWNEVFTLATEERINLLSSLGGEEGEHAISEIVLHLLNKGYIDSFLEFCKEKKIDC